MPQTTWEQTNGTVVEIKPITTRGRRQLIVTYSYDVKGQRYEGELYTFKSMNVGESLIVNYNVSNLAWTGFEAAYVRKWRTWWIMMLALFVAAVLLTLWTRTHLHQF